MMAALGRNVTERYAGMKEEIAAIRATVTSPDRTVTVTAGPGGTVFDIRLSEQVMQSPPQVVSGSVMTTLRLAVAEGARQQAAIVQRYLGDRMNILDRVMAAQRELLGDQKDDNKDDKKDAAQNRRSPGPDNGYLRLYGSDE
jgi:DNA-binding protein YbaB